MHSIFIHLVLIILFATSIGFVWYATVLLDPVLATVPAPKSTKAPSKSRRTPSSGGSLVTVPSSYTDPVYAAFRCPYFVLVGYAISTIFVFIAVNKFHLIEKLIYVCCIGIVCFGWNITCALFVLNHIGSMKELEDRRTFGVYDNVKQCLVSSSIVYFLFDLLLALMLIARKEHGCVRWCHLPDEAHYMDAQSSGQHSHDDDECLYLMLDKNQQTYRTMSKRSEDRGSENTLSENDDREVVFTSSTRREKAPERNSVTRRTKTPESGKASRRVTLDETEVSAQGPKTPAGAATAATSSNDTNTATVPHQLKTPEQSKTNMDERPLEIITPMQSSASSEFSYSRSPYGASPPSFEEVLPTAAAEAVARAAARYDEQYKKRMQNLSAPSMHANAKPFIGFSLADNVKDSALVVDGVYDAGPAAQVGVDIDDELLAVAGVPVTSIMQVRDLVAANCHPGYVTPFRLRSAETGETFDADVWVMTTDAKFYGKPYFFNPKTHTVRQSDRLKQTWRDTPEQSTDN